MHTRLTLQKDQWIDVKDRLKVRDTSDVHSHSVDGVATDGLTYRFNIVKHQIATAAVRITNWSVKDEDGKNIPWPVRFKDRVTTIEGLDAEVFEDVAKAVTEHVRAMEEAADDAKKSTPDGETDSGPSSSSAS